VHCTLGPLSTAAVTIFDYILIIMMITAMCITSAMATTTTKATKIAAVHD